MRDQLTVVIAAWNEADSLPLLQPRLAKVLDALSARDGIDARVLYVDDGSTDHTWDVLQAFSEADYQRRWDTYVRSPGGYAANVEVAQTGTTYTVMAFADSSDDGGRRNAREPPFEEG